MVSTKRTTLVEPLLALVGLMLFVGCRSESAPAADAGSCDEGQARCEGTCVNPDYDERHCGGCGKVCPAGQLCVEGGCAPVCEGKPNFAAPAPHALAGKPRKVISGEVNGDEQPDVVVSGDGIGVQIWKGSAGGELTADLVLDAGPTPGTMLLLNLNDDALNDLIVSNGPANSLQVFRGTADGGLSYATSVSLPSSADALASEDLNLDESTDLVYTSTSAGKVGIQLGGPLDAGTYSPGPTYDAPAPRGMLLRYLDEDEHPDLITLNGGDGTVSTYPGQQGGAFGAPTSFPGVSSPLVFGSADVNDDTFEDLVLASGDGVCGVLLNDGEGKFKTEPGPKLPEGLVALELVDLNQDSITDLLAATSAPPTVQTFYGNGRGGFITGQTVTLPDPVVGLTVQDLNDDGAPEVIAITSGGAQSLVVLKNVCQ